MKTAQELGLGIIDLGKFGSGLKLINKEGVELSKQILDDIEDDKGLLLCEAVELTFEPLVLEISHKNTVVAEVEFQLKTDFIKNMYRHLNLLSESGDFKGAATTMEKPKNDPMVSDKYFVLLHGYNVNEKQAQAWHAEFFKRMWWSGSKANFIGVSWRGAESQKVLLGFTPNYHANVINGFQSSKKLAETINGLGGEVTIAAHSLGNIVVSSAIQDHGMKVQNYFPFDAAVAIEAYDANATKQKNMYHNQWREYPEFLWASEWHTLSWPKNDIRKTLTWRGRFSNVASATKVTNFYSTGEEVLANADDITRNSVLITIVDGVIIKQGIKNAPIVNTVFEGDLIGEYAWVFQELLKGRAITGKVLGSKFGGWRFNFEYVNFRLGGNTPKGYFKWDQGPGGHYTRVLTPEEAKFITLNELKEKPFFWLYPEHYKEYDRNGLLAKAFPALTYAVGSNEVEVFDENGSNVNMMNQKNSWWTSDPKKQRWLHSDIKDVAYTYTHKVYDLMVRIGGLEDN